MIQRRSVRFLLSLVIVTLALQPQVSGAAVTHAQGFGRDITTPDNGVGAIFPDRVHVSGFSGTIARVIIQLFVTHANPDDLDIMLVGPTGTKVVLMSDAGGATDSTHIELRFDTTSQVSLPDNGP